MKEKWKVPFDVPSLVVVRSGSVRVSRLGKPTRYVFRKVGNSIRKERVR